MASSNTEANSALTALPALVSGCDVSGFDEAQLKKLLAKVRRGQRGLEGLVVRIGMRSNELAAQGESAPADETMRGNGDSKVGADQSRREAGRSQTAEEIDGLGEAVSNGEFSGDHLDTIKRRLAKLTDEQRAGNA